MGALDTQYPTSAGMAQTGAYTDEIKALLQQLPFAEMHYDIFDKCSWSSAQCAAVTQYMFLESVIHNTTDKYDFNLWDFHAFDYRRWSINTILFKGSDLNSEHIAPDDEQSISVDLPRAKGQHCGAVGQALVVHLAYYPQRDNGADKLLSAFEQLACKFTGDLLPDVAA